MRRGFLLVMVAGVLTLLALTSVVFLQLSRFAGLSAHVGAAGVESRLAAESGLAYAAGRLWESTDRFPGTTRLGEPGFDINASRKATVANRGDDWHYRGYDRDDGSHFSDMDGAIPVEWLDPLLEETPHPSYARGEVWKEETEDGLFDPATEIWLDADRNGRRDVYSGRLRGAPSAGTRFSLRVEPGADGKLPINCRPNLMDANYKFTRELLNKLGAVLGFPDVGITSGNGVRMAWSDVGDRLYAAFPQGGWCSIEDLKSSLPLQEWRALRRFVTTSVSIPNGSMNSHSHLLNLNAAPARLLEAFLRFSYARGVDRIAQGLSQASSADVDDHTGLPYTAYPDIMILHPPEAHRAAAELHRRAQVVGGYRSRLELFRYIDWRKGLWFPNRIQHRNDPSLSFPSEGYQNMKADLTFFTLFGGRSRETPAGLATYDLDRFHAVSPGTYPGGGRQRMQAPIITEGGMRFQFAKPSSPFTDHLPWSLIGVPWVRPTYDWILGPCSVFDVLSVAVSDAVPTARQEGSLQVGEVVWLKTQEDFQNLSGYPLPWGRPGADPPETRTTKRGFQVRGQPAFPLHPDPGVVTLPTYPRETYSTGGFLLSTVLGGVAPGHAPQDYLAATGGACQVSFGYGPLPDLDSGPQLAWKGPGFEALPVSRVGFDSSTEVCGAANAAMPNILTTATPYGASLDMKVDPAEESPLSRYTFYQAGAPGTPENPNSLPALPVGRAPVPGALTAANANSPPGNTGDFQAVTNAIFHLTYTGHVCSDIGTADSPKETVVFALYNTNFDSTGGGTCMRLLRSSDGNWILDFVNGTLVTINPADPKQKVSYADASWGILSMDPDWGASRAGHRHRIKKLYKPPAASDVPSGDWRSFFWEEASPVHRITIYYFAEDADAGGPQYPPTRIRCGVLIDGQKVIEQAWTRVLNAPCPPFTFEGYDPSASPYPCAEMFYRVGSGNIQLMSLANDNRRQLNVIFNRCTDVVFGTAPGGNNPNAAAAEAYARQMHDAYRGPPNDFFRRGPESFRSALYVLPEPAVFEGIDWGGVLPQALWEQLSSPETALRLTVEGYRADGSSLGTVPLKFARVPDETAGAEPLWLPRGSRPAPWGREKAASFSFAVDFDLTGWPADTPLIEVPALEEVSVALKTPIRWMDPRGTPAISADTGE